jgi:hypothetical protein
MPPQPPPDDSESLENLALLAEIKRNLDKRNFERIERGVYYGKLVWGIAAAVGFLFLSVMGLAYNAGRTSEKLQTAISAHEQYITDLKHAEVRNRLKTIERHLETTEPRFQKWIPEHAPR